MNKKILGAAVPVYITNLCDSTCTMCSMNRDNSALIRIDGKEEEIKNQLDIIFDKERVTWVMILSGEYKQGPYRNHHLERVVQITNYAIEKGFERITLNIGALGEEEIGMLYKNIISPEKTGLAVFQETYNREIYEQRFGKFSKDIPKTDFDKRYNTPELWLKQGFTQINLGVLIGAGNAKEDLESMIAHADYLYRRYPCKLQISLPRVVQNHGGCSDKEYKGYLCYIRENLPWAEIIITTREKKEFIGEVLPYIDVISPGTSQVLGYTEYGEINNDPNKSQFFIKKRRERPSQILNYFKSEYNLNFRYMRG